MKRAKLGKGGRLSMPRSVLRKLGISGVTPVLVEAIQDGAILIRPAAVYPIETDGEERIREFLAADRLDPERSERLRKILAEPGK